MGERLIPRWGSKGTPDQRVRSPPSECTPLIPPCLTCSGGLAPCQGISRPYHYPIPSAPPSPAAAAWPPVRASLEFSAPPAMTLLLLSTFPNTNDLLAALADAARCSEAVAVRPMKEAP